MKQAIKIAAWALAIGPAFGLSTIAATTPNISYASAPEDLGPSAIDVSNYPQDYQKIYHDVFVPVFKFLGYPARVINSPIIEMDPRLEAAERKSDPRLFTNPDAAQVTRDGWRKWAEKIYQRPPCCSACLRLTKAQAKELWRFMAYDSLRRKTGANTDAWIAFRESLIARYRAEYGSFALNVGKNAKAATQRSN